MLENAASWGADGFELMPVDPTRLEPASIRANLDRYGLEAGAVGTALINLVAGMTLLDPDPQNATQAKFRLNQTIDFAAAIGAPLLTIGSFRGRFSTAGGQGRQQLASILHEAANYAQSCGIQLVLEPINRYQSDGITTAAEGLAFLTEMDHPAIGLMLDTCHMNMEESSWTQPFRQAMDAGLLWYVHIADNNRLPPGRGLIDFNRIISILQEIGYSGYLAAEVLALPDPDTAAQQVLAFMRPLLRSKTA